MDTLQLPKISKEFIETLIKLFPKRPIKVDTPINVIMFEAGRQDILDFIRRHAQYDEVLGSVPDRPKQTDIKKTFLSRWLK